MRILNKIKNKISSEQHRDFLLKYLPTNSIGVEIGVHLGDFSERILKITKPKTLHLVDPWKYENEDTYKDSFYGGKEKDQIVMDKRYESVILRFKKEIDSGKVIVHRDSSDILKNFEDRSLDWVYIDGNHLYEFVKNDLLLSCSKVKDGGIIAGDDYTEGGWWKGGVKKAVDELISKNKTKLIKIQNSQFILKNQK